MNSLDRKFEAIYRFSLNVTGITIVVMSIILSVQFYRVYAAGKQEAKIHRHYIQKKKPNRLSKVIPKSKKSLKARRIKEFPSPW